MNILSSDRRIALSLALWSGCLLGAYAAPARAAETATTPDDRLNVLLIVADDMNNHLGCYGFDVESPSIDALAKRGMRFDRAYCQVAVCNPSRVSMLSGLRPDRTRVFTLSETTRSHLGDWVMLPEYFRNHGYFTAQIGKIYHTGDGFEDPRSWDLEIREFGKRPEPEEILRGGEPGGPGGPGRHTGDWAWLKTPDEQTPDGIVARRAVEVMKEAASGDEAFFLGIGFRRPHAPFAAPKKYFDLYPLDALQLPDPGPDEHLTALLPPAINYPLRAREITPLEQRELLAAYYACNSFVDAQLKVVLEAVSDLSLWENTIVVFLGDHGYHLGEHGGLWHKMSLFEESARVPLIIYAPQMKGAGQPCAQLVELVDLYPTLISLCGLPAHEDLDGIDISPLLDDPAQPIQEAAYTVTTRDDSPEQHHARAMSYLGRSVRTDRWRYTEWDGGRRGVELYDHEQDPHEWNNLAENPEHAETVRRLRELLRAEGKSATPSP